MNGDTVEFEIFLTYPVKKDLRKCEKGSMYAELRVTTLQYRELNLDCFGFWLFI